MATIRKRSGKYHTQIRKNGDTITRTFISKSDALKWSKEEEVKIEKGIYFPEDKNITLSFLLSKWEKEILINLKSHHVEKYKVAMLQRALGHLTIDKVTSNVLVQYRDERLKKASNQTVKHELGLILRAMRKGVEWGFVKSIPILTLPSLKGQARNRRLKKEELEHLIDTLDPYLRNITILLIETSMRRGELSALNLKNIDLEQKLVHLLDTKNGENRTIPLSMKALSSITYLIENAHTERLLNCKSDWITEKFINHCKRLGIEDFRLHDLRHEGVSQLFEKGLNTMEVSAISGHKDLTMLKRYTHINPSTLISKIN